MEPTPVEEIKDECKSCQIKIVHNGSSVDKTIKLAFHCRWCDGWEEDETSDDGCEATKELTKTSFYCRSCTRKCWHCKTRGCEECVDVVCCDCSVRMCSDCRNSDILCGCYGECYTCGCEVDRGSDGWPCNDCEKWYCDSCRYDDNDCQECNPRSEEEEEEDEEEEETPYINVEEKVETSEETSEATKEKIEENSTMNVETSEKTSEKTSEGSHSCFATKGSHSCFATKGSDSCEATKDKDADKIITLFNFL